MPIDPQLLDQALRTPESRDVTESPVVLAVILRDPANAPDLVPALEEPRMLRGRNARRILCLFDADAAPHLVRALRNAGTSARKEGLEILWTMMLGESSFGVRDRLAAMKGDLQVLLDDPRPLPDVRPEYIERDFRGRICDLAFLVVQQLIDPKYDQSFFRSLEPDERDREIARGMHGLGPPGVA